MSLKWIRSDDFQRISLQNNFDCFSYPILDEI